MSKQSLRTAILEAIRAEKLAMDFYLAAAAHACNQRPKLTFKLLAREEREHARAFYDSYPHDDLDPFEDLMGSPPDTSAEWWQELNEVMSGRFDEAEALKLSLAHEKMLESDLRETAKTIEDPEIRLVYLKNAELTHQHQLLIENDYQAIAGE
ncbi:MAG: rubrerythrin [Desulfuromonas sp.]|nr:MAG: rubrerythrin [Desulfuromonas sp.]